MERLAWRPDGKQLTTTSRDVAHVWNLKSGREKVLTGHSDVVSAVIYNHSGTLLASDSYDGTTRFWNSSTAELLLSTHRGFIEQFSADDKRAVFQRYGEGEAGVGLWQLAAGSGARAVHLDEPTQGFTTDFSPDDRLLALMARDGLHVIDVQTNPTVEMLHQPVPGGRTVIFHPNGKTLITTGTNGISLWPLELVPEGNNGRLGLGQPRHLVVPNATFPEYSSLSADGRTLALDLGRHAAVIDLEGSTPPVICADPDYHGLSAVAISPDSRWVATGTFHGSGTRVWDAHTGKPFRHLDSITASVTFSPDGKWLLTGSGEEFTFWETSTWRRVRTLPRDTADVLAGTAAFSRDGKFLAIAQTQRLLKILNAETGDEIASLNSPNPQFLRRLSFNSDATMLAAATFVTGVQLWDLRELRRKLADLRLDWADPARTSEPTSTDAVAGEKPGSLPAGWRPSAAPIKGVDVSFIARGLIVVVLVGVTLAVLSGFFVLQRHRRLMEGYGLIEEQMAERNRELERAKTEIVHSQKMKALGTLAAGIAHDFNNLLSVIRMSNKLIGRATRQTEEIKENVTEIEQAVQQGKQVVRSMLGYSREEADDQGPFSVAEVVEDTLALLSKEFLSGIRLTLELAPDTPKVNVSRGRLEQVLLNLVVNAAEAMDGSGSLRLTVRALAQPWQVLVLRPRSAARYVELAVTDSGPGIKPEIVERIFEPFFTTKGARTSPGTGLGLSMVYSIAEQDGIGISMETSLGSGTTFRIAVPVD